MTTKKYVRDYEIVRRVDENGREVSEVVYRGQYFKLSPDDFDLRSFKHRSLLLTAAIIVLHAAAGFVSNPGMVRMYISLPYTLAFFPLLFLAAGILQLPADNCPFRRDEIGLSFDRMRLTSRLLMPFLSVIVLGEILFLVFTTVQPPLALELGFLIPEMLCLGMAYQLIRWQLPIHILPSEAGNRGN